MVSIYTCMPTALVWGSLQEPLCLNGSVSLTNIHDDGWPTLLPSSTYTMLIWDRQYSMDTHNLTQAWSHVLSSELCDRKTPSNGCRRWEGGVHPWVSVSCIFTIHLCVYQCDALLPPHRPYAIPNATKHKTDSGRKSGYYTAILSGKEDRGIWHLSTTKHFVSSQRQRGMQVSLFASMSVRSCWDLAHSGCKCKIISCTGEKGARKVLKLCRPRPFLPLKMAT